MPQGRLGDRLLQQSQNLAPGELENDRLVVVVEDPLELVDAEISPRRHVVVDANRAAVDEGDIATEALAQDVAEQVAQRRLAAADRRLGPFEEVLGGRHDVEKPAAGLLLDRACEA